MSSLQPDGTAIQGKRFLVVEDEFLILLDIQSILETAGAQSIVTASSLADGLAAIESGGHFDAAVLDLKLGRDSSMPIAERLKATGIPFVLLTGAPNEAGVAQQFAAAPVVGKPFSGEILLAALTKAMRR